jgi:hypothetical protein
MQVPTPRGSRVARTPHQAPSGPDSTPYPPAGPRLHAARLHDITVRIYADDRELDIRIAEFLDPLVASGAAGDCVLEFHVALGEPEPSAVHRFETRDQLQFYNVACARYGDALVYRSMDGSVLEADIALGRGWGTVTRDLLADARRHIFADLFLAPLMEMLKHRGYCGLHAGAVMRDNVGYLFPGSGGAGKTTTALGLIKRGFQYLADDKVLLREEDGRIAALAFTRRFNIDPDIGACYPELAFVDRLEPLHGCNKRPVDVSAVYDGSFAPRCQPRFIVHLQRIGERTSRLVPLSRAESFGRLMRQTVISDRRATAERQLELIGRLLRDSRSYLLCNGGDLYGVPERIDQLLPRD